MRQSNRSEHDQDQGAGLLRIVGKEKGFRSKPLDTGNQFSFTFAAAGD